MTGGVEKRPNAENSATSDGKVSITASTAGVPGAPSTLTERGGPPSGNDKPAIAGASDAVLSTTTGNATPASTDVTNGAGAVSKALETTSTEADPTDISAVFESANPIIETG